MTGPWSDPGPSSSGPCGSCSQHQDLVHQGQEDQGYLLHAEHAQPGRHPEMSDRRVLVPRAGSGPHPAGPAKGHCK